MIDQQSGISLESLLRGILGIVTVLAVAYALSYDRKRIDWKLIGGGLIMQVIFALGGVICSNAIAMDCASDVPTIIGTRRAPFSSASIRAYAPD